MTLVQVAHGGYKGAQGGWLQGVAQVREGMNDVHETRKLGLDPGVLGVVGEGATFDGGHISAHGGLYA